MGAAVNKTSTLPFAPVQLLLDGIDLAAEKNPGLGSMRLARVKGSLPNYNRRGLNMKRDRDIKRKIGEDLF